MPIVKGASFWFNELSSETRKTKWLYTFPAFLCRPLELAQNRPCGAFSGLPTPNDSEWRVARNSHNSGSNFVHCPQPSYAKSND